MPMFSRVLSLCQQASATRQSIKLERHGPLSALMYACTRVQFFLVDKLPPAHAPKALVLKHADDANMLVMRA